MLTEEQIKQFDQNGFLKGGRVLSDDQVDRLREELDLVMSGKSVKKPVLNRNMLESGDQGMSMMGMGMEMKKSEKVIQIVNMWMASDAYLQHACNTKICEEVAQLCRTDALRIWHDQVQYKPPVTGGSGSWHQDHPAWPIIAPADLVSAWVALDDATIENGAMWMVPGSHKWGDQMKYLKSSDDYKPVHERLDLLPEDANIEPIPFEIKKGHVGYHHCLTWHGSRNNPTDRKRRAIAVHYMPKHIRYEPTGGHPMEPYITVKPGEILSGDSFPVVYTRA